MRQFLQRHGLTTLIGLGLAAIIVVTFATSFDAISSVAVDRGAVAPSLGWAIPVGVDGLIVVGSAIAWLIAMRLDRWHPFPIGVVALAAAVSVWANIAHSQSADLLARVLAGSSPVALLLAVELGAWWLRQPRPPSGADLPVIRTGTVDLDAAPFLAATDEVARNGHPTHVHVRDERGEVLERIERQGDGSDPLDDLWAAVEAVPVAERSGIGQRKLAERLGTTRHQISKLIDADAARYERLTS